MSTHFSRFRALAYVLPHFDALTHRSVFAESLKAFIFQKFAVNLLWIKPSTPIFQHGSSLSLENVCDSCDSNQVV